MSDLAPLESRRFRRDNEADWRRLERLLERLEAGSLRRLSDSEIIALPGLYRSTLSSLSIARAISLDRALVDYLEGLSARAYFAVYGLRKSPAAMAVRFFAHDWPAAVRSLWRETLAATLVFVAGLAAALVMVRADPANFPIFLDAGMAQGRGPGSSAQALSDILRHGGAKDPLAAFAAFLFTHNAQIALEAFALGVLACAPTALLVAQNGGSLGALIAIYQAKGLALPLGGWLLIHGVTEISAILLAAGAGFRLGWTLIFPGRLSRPDALKAQAPIVGAVMTGVVIMLSVAGLLEGFGRQLVQDTGLRYAIAAATAVLWGGYFYAPRGRAFRGERRP